MSSVIGRRGAPAAKSRKAPPRESKGRGRPEGASKVRDDILNAAERVFSNQGYAGTTLREVSDIVKVTQALINYYFGSKFGLFGEVFLRRATKISQDRMDQLAELKARGGKLDLSQVVRAFLQPTLGMRATAQGRAFLRLQARLHTEPPNISYDLRQAAYSESTRAYIETVHECLPHLTEMEVHWRVTMMIGTYLYAFSDTHRMEDMAPDGQYDPKDSETLMEQVTRFVVKGMR
jgi:AcrR family transcriptional regulator